MRHLLVLVLTLFFAPSVLGQPNKIYQEKIKEAKTIAQLYDTLEHLGQFQNFVFWSFNYQSDSLKVFDLSGGLQSSSTLNDTLALKKYCYEAVIWDSTDYRGYYCKEFQNNLRVKRYSLACKIVHLMVNNKFLALSNGGIGVN